LREEGSFRQGEERNPAKDKERVFSVILVRSVRVWKKRPRKIHSLLLRPDSRDWHRRGCWESKRRERARGIKKNDIIEVRRGRGLERRQLDNGGQTTGRRIPITQIGRKKRILIPSGRKKKIPSGSRSSQSAVARRSIPRLSKETKWRQEKSNDFEGKGEDSAKPGNH